MDVQFIVSSIQIELLNIAKKVLIYTGTKLEMINKRLDQNNSNFEFQRSRNLSNELNKTPFFTLTFISCPFVDIHLGESL